MANKRSRPEKIFGNLWEEDVLINRGKMARHSLPGEYNPRDDVPGPA